MIVWFIRVTHESRAFCWKIIKLAARSRLQRPLKEKEMINQNLTSAGTKDTTDFGAVIVFTLSIYQPKEQKSPLFDELI